VKSYPPPPITTYHSRGVWKPPFLLQNCPPKNKTIFSPVQHFIFQERFRANGNEFSKFERLFFITGCITKISLIIYIGVNSWENWSHLWALFFLFWSWFAGAISASWRWIWKNRKRFLSRTYTYTINYLILYTCDTVEEKKISESTPFSKCMEHTYPKTKMQKRCWVGNEHS